MSKSGISLTETTGYRYYDILNVPKRATRNEIRKSYYALALEYHPDRNVRDSASNVPVSTEEVARKEAMFKAIQEAYGILSDETKRKMYDQVGDQGLDMLMNGGVGEALANPILIVLLSALFWIGTTLLLIFLILVILRVDQPERADKHPIRWSWPVVFTPIWILDFFPLLVATLLVFTQIRDLEMNSLPVVLTLFCLAAAPITLVLALMGKLAAIYAFVPVLPAIVMQVVRRLAGLSRRHFINYCASSGVQEETYGYLPYVLYVVFTSFCLLTFSALMAAKLVLMNRLSSRSQFTNTFDKNINYAAVFAPLIAYLIASSLKEIGISMRSNAGSRRCENPTASGWFACLMKATAVALIKVSTPISFLVLLGVYLDTHAIKFVIVCIPLLITMSVFNLISCCMCSALSCSLTSAHHTEYGMFSEEEEGIKA